MEEKNNQVYDSVFVICYGKKKMWHNRKDAIEFYLKAMMSSEGSERERYNNIYLDLISGESVCRDTEEDESWMMTQGL